MISLAIFAVFVANHQYLSQLIANKLSFVLLLSMNLTVVFVFNNKVKLSLYKKQVKFNNFIALPSIHCLRVNKLFLVPSMLLPLQSC